jgi:hypothetical protein
MPAEKEKWHKICSETLCTSCWVIHFHLLLLWDTGNLYQVNDFAQALQAPMSSVCDPDNLQQTPAKAENYGR